MSKEEYTVSFTPGPWHYVYGAAWTTPGGPDDGGQCVAQRAWGDANRIEPAVRDRNLRLCAAAPELLQALNAYIEWGESVPYGAPKNLLRLACAATSKATGT